MNIEKVKVEFGDCRDLIKAIPSNSISTVITSPPYNLGKNYGVYDDNVDFEQWKKLIKETSQEVLRVLKPNGSFFLNVSPIPDKKTKEIIPLDSIAYIILKDLGFFLRNKIIWHFNNMQNCVNRLSGRWEAILWFVKDINNYIFNLDEIRIPYITQNDKRLVGGNGRNPTDVWDFEQNNIGDFWYFDRVNNMTKNKLGLTEHPCIYPINMIDRIIKMNSFENDIILDPFVGSGTTLVSALRLNRNSIGFELDKKYEAIIFKRLENEAHYKKDLLFAY